MIYNHTTGKAKKQADKTFFIDKANVSRYSSTLTDIEWAQINPGTVVVATAARSWLCQSSSLFGRFAQPMDCPGSIATTKKLLDGAIAAAKYVINSDVRPPALTSTRWVWRLAGAYHLCHPTLELMEEASAGFALIGHWSLAEWAAQKANEEEGHDRLALRDIQSMGYDPKAVVKALVPPAAVALIDYFTRSVQETDPIDCVGYSYTMERLALGVDKKYIQKVEDLLAPGVNATRCLRVHSSIGADIEQTEETVEMVAELTAKERTRIARACYKTALMCFSPPQESYISDSELQQILKPLKLSKKS